MDAPDRTNPVMWEVPTRRVEVGDTVRRLVRNTDPLQVFLHHEPCLLPLDTWKEKIIRSEISHPLTHHCDEFRVHRQRVFSAMLGTRRLDRQDR